MCNLARMSVLLWIILVGTSLVIVGNEEQPDSSWRSIPLITDGKIDQNWVQVGYGEYIVDNNSIRSECDEKGLGLLLYKKEPLGNCQIRIVYKCKESKSNAGIFVRIDEGILDRLDEKHPPAKREPDGTLSKEMLKIFMVASEKEQGGWYPVHHGYEVQILENADESHRTGAIYSLAKSSYKPEKQPGEWKTMIITLLGNQILVDIDGKRVTTFESDSKDVPQNRAWYEPSRENKRPEIGYIGLQTHDPGDVVYFKEISVRAVGQ